MNTRVSIKESVDAINPGAEHSPVLFGLHTSGKWGQQDNPL